MENISLIVVDPSEPDDPQLCPRPIGTSGSAPVCSHSNRKMSSRTPNELNIFSKLLSAGTAACLADAATFPMDTAKVRLQIQGEGARQSVIRYSGLTGTLYAMAKTEGFRSWYRGITAGLQRQMAFASIRIGLYENVKGYYMDVFDVKQNSTQFATRIAAGLTTGAFAVLFAQPTDVVKVRLQAQSSRGGGEIRYLSTAHAYKTIAIEEGVRGMWKGAVPNILRSSIINVTEVVSYDYIKEFFLTRKILPDNIVCHGVSGFGAGLCTVLLASPVDVVKTRFMNSAPNTYSGVIDCATTMARTEGPTAFYKGFMPAFVRLGSWNILMFVTYEQVKILALTIQGNRSSNNNSMTDSPLGYDRLLTLDNIPVGSCTFSY